MRPLRQMKMRTRPVQMRRDASRHVYGDIPCADKMHDLPSDTLARDTWDDLQICTRCDKIRTSTRPVRCTSSDVAWHMFYSNTLPPDIHGNAYTRPASR